MKVRNLLFALILVSLIIPIAGAPGAMAGGGGGGGGDTFRFGARMDTRLAVSPSSSNTVSSLALAIAAQSHLNWIAFELDWAAVAPQASAAPDLTGLAALIAEAQRQQLEILLSIQNPPEWARTANGPAPEMVQVLINQISLVSANRVHVIELFPGANVARSWGAPANPTHYLTVLQAARAALRANQQISMVVPSLTPLNQTIDAGDISAEAFLSALYQQAPNENFQVVGLHYSELTGNPADYGQDSSGAFLRQYEIVRQVMLDNGRSGDGMWITAFSWPNSLTSEADQAAWVESAYRQLQGQIYIKAAFFNALYIGAAANPSASSTAALLQPTLKAHAALARIRELAAQDKPASAEPENLSDSSPFARFWEFLRSLFRN